FAAFPLPRCPPRFPYTTLFRSLVAMFSGLATAVEASALTALYALVVQAAIHRDLSLRRDLLRAFTECVTVIGGVLIILGVAVGLDRKSTRLNSSHQIISYAVFC